MKVWISRDKTWQHNLVRFWGAEPSKGVEGDYNGTSVVDDIRLSEFKHIFKWTPRKGSCEQVELNIERKK